MIQTAFTVGQGKNSNKSADVSIISTSEQVPVGGINIWYFKTWSTSRILLIRHTSSPLCACIDQGGLL